MMKVGPSHRISEYVAEYARPEKARDTTTGAPSAWKALQMMAKQAAVKPRRLHASVLDSTVVIASPVVVASFPSRLRYLHSCVPSGVKKCPFREGVKLEDTNS